MLIWVRNAAKSQGNGQRNAVSSLLENSSSVFGAHRSVSERKLSRSLTDTTIVEFYLVPSLRSV